MQILYFRLPEETKPEDNKAIFPLFTFLKKLGLPCLQHAIFISDDHTFLSVMEFT